MTDKSIIHSKSPIPSNLFKIRTLMLKELPQFALINKMILFFNFSFLDKYLNNNFFYLILRQAKSTSSKPGYSGVIECILNLAVFLIFFLALLTWSSWEVQNSSRRLCNLSFICFTVY